MAYYVRKQDLILLNSGFDNWNNNLPVNKEVIISFINGFELMLQSDDKLISKNEQYILSNLMRNYLWNNYRIWHIDLERALKNLAIIKHQQWVEVFIFEFSNFQNNINWELEYARLNLNPILKSQLLNKIDIGKELNNYTCRDGQKIEKGTIVQLGDLMKEDYKYTLLFDSSLECPQWDILIPSERSFKTVQFSHGSKTFGNVVAAYSLMTSEVLTIYNVNGSVFIQTSCFYFEIEKAISKAEIIIGDKQKNDNQEWQEGNMNSFHVNAENYLLKLISKSELWSGIIGFDIYAPFFGRKKSAQFGRGYYRSSLESRWNALKNIGDNGNEYS